MFFFLINAIIVIIFNLYSLDETLCNGQVFVNKFVDFFFL